MKQLGFIPLTLLSSSCVVVGGYCIDLPCLLEYQGAGRITRSKANPSTNTKVNKTERSIPDVACKDVVRALQIGTCGFGLAKEAYGRAFSCVEIQHTFYQPPQIKTLERWRREMPSDFEFTIKAWQLITHDARSPTYRRLKRKLTETEKQEAGYFRSTAIVKEAWDTTLASARALEAKTILFQCPASFKQCEENISSMEKFFSTIDRKGLNLCWEPRGGWDTAVVRSVCNRLRLWHVVDPFVGKTTTPDKCYFRLHGKDGWRYQYETSELEELAAALPRNVGYVFFNNSKMTEDASRFCRVLSDREAFPLSTIKRSLPTAQ